MIFLRLLLLVFQLTVVKQHFPFTLDHLTFLGEKAFHRMQLVIDAAAEDDPKAKSLTPSQLFDLSFLP